MPLLPKNRDHGWAPYVWLIFLAFFFLQPVADHAGRTEWLITLGATAVFVVMYFAVFWVPPLVAYFLLAGMAALGIGLAKFNAGSSVFIIFCASFIPWVFCTAKRAYAALLLLLAAISIHGYFFHPPVGFLATSFIVALGVTGSNIHFAEKNRADTKLRMAHEEIEHLAKVAERERIARDLHDVLGHTLSLIIVKSTLAGKLIEKYPEKARSEIADIEKVSREAIAEIRGTLRGYSTYKLTEELQRAKAALGSAGVELKTQTAEVTLTPAQESVLALITREAVTNVVRHAHARRCWLKLATNNGDCVLEIQDDGHGGFQSEGNGVRGMRERIEALGGKLERDTFSGTKLRFEFPLTPNGTH
jgi:two-component system, NarL family, sensor histidine kinase DesK